MDTLHLAQKRHIVGDCREKQLAGFLNHLRLLCTDPVCPTTSASEPASTHHHQKKSHALALDQKAIRRPGDSSLGVLQRTGDVDQHLSRRRFLRRTSHECSFGQTHDTLSYILYMSL